LSEKKVLMKMFGTGRLRWAGHTARMENTRNGYYRVLR